MSDLIAILFTNPTGALVGIGAFIAAAIAAFFKIRSGGAKAERAKQMKAQLAAKEDQLEMHREADAILRGNAALSDAEARAKAGRRLG